MDFLESCVGLMNRLMRFIDFERHNEIIPEDIIYLGIDSFKFFSRYEGYDRVSGVSIDNERIVSVIGSRIYKMCLYFKDDSFCNVVVNDAVFEIYDKDAQQRRMMKTMANQRLHVEVETLEKSFVKDVGLQVVVPDCEVFVENLELVKKWISQKRFRIVVGIHGMFL